MMLRNMFTITTLAITGAVGGVIIGNLFSMYIIRGYSADKNSMRWYIGNFSAMFCVISGAVIMPYKYCVKFEK